MRRGRALIGLATAVVLVLGNPASAATMSGSWRVVPDEPTSTTTETTALSCTSATWCLAVGTNATQIWNGLAWRSYLRTTQPLADVSCAAEQDCTAVGMIFVSPGDPRDEFPRPIAEHWTSSGWEAMTLPASVMSEDGVLTNVSCPSADDCAAVGLVDETLAWDGTSWTVEALPQPTGARAWWLSAVDCPAADDCQGVGQAEMTDGSYRALAATWDGAAWTTELLAGSADLTSIDCPTTTSCVAVGASSQLLEYPASAVWDGTTWSATTTPYDATYEALVTDVSCLAPDACLAVGLQDPVTGAPLHLAWDGADWTSVPGPTVSSTIDGTTSYAYTKGIDCPSSTVCLAVGGVATAGAVGLPYSERWNSSPLL